MTTEPRAPQIARLIEADLLKRNLPAGAPYLGTDEVAKMFGIHLRTAHRALSVLADRNLLVRKRGAGTFVGPAMNAESTGPGVVHVLISGARVKRGVNEPALLQALRRYLPGTGVQINLLPGSGTESDAAGALGVSLAAGVASGIVLIGCDRPVQDYVARIGIPAVVFGGVFATAASLASVDIDHRRIGAVLAEHLVQRGHRRVAILMHDLWLPGDNLFVEGISQVFSPNDVHYVMRSTQIDQAALKPEARSIAALKPAVTAVICRSKTRYENFAPAFLANIERGGGESAGIDLVYDDAEYTGIQKDVYACADTSMVDQLDQVGGLLQSLIQSKEIPNRHQFLPVRLVAR